MSLHYTRSEARIGRNPERGDISPNKRTFYINDELPTSKDVATTFHSPYKNGKRNAEFCNPTFASSDIFHGYYFTRKCLTPRHNLIYNKNQRERDDLYKRRMQKEDFVTNMIHKTVAQDLSQRKTTRKANDYTMPKYVLGRSISRSCYRGNREQQLETYLQTLLKYRNSENARQNSVSRRLNTTGNLSRNQYFKEYTPIYQEKNRENLYRNTYQHTNNIKDWMAVSDKIKKLKYYTKEDYRKTYVKNVDHFVYENLNRNHLKEIESRKNASLLANILREQIKQSYLKKIQYKKDKQSLN